MATQTIMTLVDDVDGSKAVETITFALDGHTYEIDLSAKNAKALRVAVGPWAENARRVSKPARTRSTIKPVGKSRSALIRAWAHAQGIDVPPHGRIANDIQAQYDAAR